MLRHGTHFMDTGRHGIMGMDITTSAKEVLMPNQMESLTLTLGCTIPPTDTGQFGILDIMDIMDIISEREVLKPNQKESPTLMPGYTIQPTDTGHHGIMDMDITDIILAREAL